MTTRTSFLASLEKDLLIMRNWTRGRAQTTSYFSRWSSSIPWLSLVLTFPVFLAYCISSSTFALMSRVMLIIVLTLPALLVVVISGDFFRGTWRNLQLNWQHGAAHIRLDRANYRPGDVVEVQLLSRQSRNPSIVYKVELNYVREFSVVEAEIRSTTQRSIWHSVPFNTVTAPRLADGIRITIPAEVNGKPLYSLINEADYSRYWEVLITEPKGPFYARAVLQVW